MGSCSFSSFILPLLLLTFSSMTSDTMVAEARNQLQSALPLPKVPELSKLGVPLLPEVPDLPKFDLPLPLLPSLPLPPLPPLPKPELPSIPIPEVPKVVEVELPPLPKPQLPAVPIPQVPKVEVDLPPPLQKSELPAIPKLPNISEIPKSKLTCCDKARSGYSLN